MENLQKKLGLTDAQLAEEILKRKLLSAGRLRAALDYQASVGGHLIGVLQKLGLVKENDLQVFMAKLAAGEDFVWSSETEKSPIPCPVEVSRLRVHRKLLEKIPPELVDRYNLLLFFPPPGYRAILMASDPIVKVEGVKKLQALLCVEICPIQLSAEEMAPFLAERQTERASSAAA
ncbi:MAG: hypothetical protein JXA90_02580, partial [Planctomycetes bacterium]|nr:hypothetical protein [Planctomycetota bacterium]